MSHFISGKDIRPESPFYGVTRTIASQTVDRWQA